MSAILMEAPELTSIATIRCPGCGSNYTAVARTPVQDNVLCKTCGTCWHLTEDSAKRIDIQQCAGCALQRVCIAAAGLTR